MPNTFSDKSPPPSATHLIARHHAADFDGYQTHDGECCFCGDHGPGVPVDDAVSHKYFSDYHRMQADTEHVCWSCAYCMDQRELKQGHWVVDATGHERVSTGDLPDVFAALRDDEYDPPLAVHVSENPIRSEHAYLWTPVVSSVRPLALSFDRQAVRTDWPTFERVRNAIEELRWHGFRGDDIRSGTPRIADLASVGRDRYRTLNQHLDPHRGTPLLEVAWTVSRSKDDQPAPPDSALHSKQNA